MNFAGTPPTIVFGGTSAVTTAPAATTEFSPMVTPGNIVAAAPIHALRFTTMGFKRSVFLSTGMVDNNSFANFDKATNIGRKRSEYYCGLIYFSTCDFT